VGVQFDDPVDINLFVVNCVRADPEIEYAGSAEMPKLSGRLLIVDPTDEHHQVLRFHLQKLGVRIRSAAHALAALQAARQEKFDLIITRFHLPWMNAPQAAAALRRGGYTGPIIALTDDPRLAKAPGDNAAGDLSEVRLQPDHFEDLVSWIRDQLRQTQPPQAAA
jgi:CheY-like chemotaxis protein